MFLHHGGFLRRVVAIEVAARHTRRGRVAFALARRSFWATSRSCLGAGMAAGFGGSCYESKTQLQIILPSSV